MADCGTFIWIVWERQFILFNIEGCLCKYPARMRYSSPLHYTTRNVSVNPPFGVGGAPRVGVKPYVIRVYVNQIKNPHLSVRATYKAPVDRAWNVLCGNYTVYLFIHLLIHGFCTRDKSIPLSIGIGHNLASDFVKTNPFRWIV